MSADVRLAHARTWLREQGSGGAVLVAPSRGAADDFGRLLAVEGSGFFGLHRFTPRRLALELATRSLAAEVLAPMTPLGARALAARATAAVSAQLSYLGPVANYPGFAAALARTL
ncbi:MAG: hypothetical protein GWO02_06105, partial [Gammaproteobacteria bacterium]|nr:hypothetical protein [Gammaproteobacteria bacterium]